MKLVFYIKRTLIYKLFFIRINLKNGPRARRGKPVQRAPSRLYRAIGGQLRNFNKTQCVGPEFVVRANQPSKIMTVGDVKVRLLLLHIIKYVKLQKWCKNSHL